MRKGEKVEFSTANVNNTCNNYLVGIGVKDYKILETNKKLFHFKNETILVVDSLGLYNFKSVKPSIILLQKSPKINLQRLIETVKPKLIVVDGTNYKSYSKRWEQTCIKNKTPFYSTLQKGALILKE